MKKIDLEKDFTEVCKQVNVKIKEAAKAMKEARVLAKKAGLHTMCFNDDLPRGLSDDELDQYDDIFCKIDIYPLLDEINQAGWYGSSLAC